MQSLNDNEIQNNPIQDGMKTYTKPYRHVASFFRQSHFPSFHRSNIPNKRASSILVCTFGTRAEQFIVALRVCISKGQAFFPFRFKVTTCYTPVLPIFNGGSDDSMWGLGRKTAHRGSIHRHHRHQHTHANTYSLGNTIVSDKIKYCCNRIKDNDGKHSHSVCVHIWNSEQANRRVRIDFTDRQKYQSSFVVHRENTRTTAREREIWKRYIWNSIRVYKWKRLDAHLEYRKRAKDNSRLCSSILWREREKKITNKKKPNVRLLFRCECVFILQWIEKCIKTHTKKKIKTEIFG